MTAEALRDLQLLLRVEQTGVLDEATLGKVRGLRRLWNLPGDGIDEHFIEHLRERS